MASPQEPATLIQHFGEENLYDGAVAPPIFQNSLFAFDSFAQIAESFDFKPEGRPVYSRISNPTLDVLERKLAALEHCEAAKVFSSGMAAISTAIMSCTASGSHVVCLESAYGGTQALLRDYLPRFGVETTFVDGRTTEAVIDAIRPETTLIYLESPSSVVFRIQDLAAICAEAKRRGITTAADNSFATPIHQTPADFGVDIILHSATKYLNGHSDVVAGLLTTSRDRLIKIVNNEVSLYGATLGPFPAWLMLRGLRTLNVRIRAHEAAGNLVANWLESRDEVERVIHVGLESHPQRQLILKQMRGSGGLLTFIPKCQDPDKLKAFIEGLELFYLAISWGGFESLAFLMDFGEAGHEGYRYGIRLFCGLEEPTDLIADLNRSMLAAGI